MRVRTGELFLGSFVKGFVGSRRVCQGLIGLNGLILGFDSVLVGLRWH